MKLRRVVLAAGVAALTCAFGVRANAQTNADAGARPAIEAPAVPELYGDTTADLGYTSVAPCRIIDTRIAGGQIESRSVTETSLMPAGLLDKLSDREIADLLAYLKTLK